MIADMQTLLPVAGSITVVGTAWLTVRKIAKDAAKSKKELIAEILHAAKEEDALQKAKMESKMEALTVKLASLELSVNKDVGHLKETYSNEIKNLGEKIESLREELRSRFDGTVALLTKLIEKKH
jgi:Na+-translocating ferredoxin:NAD+ oxidoreductase RnfG subunit